MIEKLTSYMARKGVNNIFICFSMENPDKHSDGEEVIFGNLSNRTMTQAGFVEKVEACLEMLKGRI